MYLFRPSGIAIIKNDRYRPLYGCEQAMTNVVNVELARPATDVPISTNCVGMCACLSTSDVTCIDIRILHTSLYLMYLLIIRIIIFQAGSVLNIIRI